MVLNFSVFSESLDEIYPLTRVESKNKNISYEEWEFKVNSTTHVVRFLKLPPNQIGERVSAVQFGIRRGRGAKQIFDGVSNIRKYLATVFKAIQLSVEDPSTLLKTKSDGIVLMIPKDFFEKRKLTLLNIAKIKFRGVLRLHKNFFDYTINDNLNGIYLWKIGRTFKSVFTDVEAEEPPVEDDELQDPIVKLPVKNDNLKPTVDIEKISPKKTDASPPLVRISDPVVQFQQSPKIIEDDSIAKIKAAKARGGKDIRKDINFDPKKYIEFVILTDFFLKYSFFEIDGETSLSENTNLDKYNDADYILNVLKFDYEDGKEGILSKEEYCFALNLSGIRTSHYSDMYSGYHFDESMKALKDKYKPKIPQKPRKNVSLDEIVELCLNAKEILTNIGVNIENKRTLRQDKMLYYTVGKVLSKKETEIVADSIIASISQFELDSFIPYEFTKSSKGTKLVKGPVYSHNNSAIKELIQFDIETFTTEKNPEKYFETYKKLPSKFQRIWSDDVEVFEVHFISSWLLAGGSFAQAIAHKSFSNSLVNAELNDFWNVGAQNNKLAYEAIDDNKDTFNKNLTSLYYRNQEFFKQKFKKKYDNHKVKLYRGIGIRTNSYIPGALESWTTQLSTAVNFAKMMQRRGDSYTVLYAEIPIQHIFGSWESFAETFEGEEDLKGKKEHIVMGGTFATTPIYEYDVSTKEVKSMKSFTEWINLEENSKLDKLKRIKIVTPSMPNFKKLFDKSGKGNDPKENEVRKMEPKKKEGE